MSIEPSMGQVNNQGQASQINDLIDRDIALRNAIAEGVIRQIVTILECGEPSGYQIQELNFAIKKAIFAYVAHQGK